MASAAPVPDSDATPRRVRIGVSSCLLGQKVRYDGQHKRDRLLTDLLGAYVEWVPVCPEVEIGLGIPRPTIRLERRSQGGERGTRLVMPSTGDDLTATMAAYAERRVAELRRADLAGYVLKKDSPSCGMERVKVWEPEGGAPSREGRGVFAEALLARMPELPVEEEGRLNDPLLRENFVARVYAYDRWREAEKAGWTRAALMRFHERHKLMLMARNQSGMRRLGRLLGESGRRDDTGGLVRAYLEGFTEAMRRPPTRRGHTNVLQHMAGYVSDLLDPGDRQELTATVDQYRRGLVPLIVPVTLLRHYVRRYDVEYLKGQHYLEPHPHELMLLNHV